jgi:hypothetical protein
MKFHGYVTNYNLGHVNLFMCYIFGFIVGFYLCVHKENYLFLVLKSYFEVY